MAETHEAPQGMHGSRRRHGGEQTSWIVGVVLILLGVAFLLEQAGLVTLTENWWAIFIYLAAGGSLANAWRLYRARGEFDSAATSSLIWGLVLAVVATIFAFNLLWDMWWPMILVAIGIGIVVGYALRGRGPDSEDPGAE